jgi:CubicO group peptidase (beta-lactamase class C family)
MDGRNTNSTPEQNPARCMPFYQTTMKFKILLLFILIIYNNFSFAQTKEELKYTITNLLTEQKLSGAVWATVSENGEIVIDSYGYKNTKTKEILNPTDKVHVGSVAKTILAASFLRMATLGLLHLDDSIKKYLPNIPIDNPWNRTNPLTIRQLLDHTSGLTDAKLWHIFSTTATPNTPLEAVYINNPDILKVQAKPGSMYSYSNLGYTILGMVIEKISRKRYENYLDENVLKPLGMTNSSFKFIAQTGIDADKQLAYGHFDDGKPVTAMPMYLRPAGQLTTTAKDIGIFLRFMMSDGKINGELFIKSEYLKSVANQKLTDAYKNGVPFGDALGAYSRDRYGVVGIAKNGNTLGFSSMIYMFPNDKKAFFIAHNMDSETANYDLFNEALVKHLGLPTHNFITNQQPIENEIANWDGYYIPFITKVEPFGLIDYVFSHTKVETTKSEVLILPFQGKKKLLIYQGKHLFSMQDRTSISHAFYKTDNGDLLITDGVKTIRKVSGLKILGIATILFLGLLGIIYLFIVGFVKLIKHKIKFINHPEFWVFISIMILLISFGFIATQPFMRMGDKTIGNILLWISSMIIPVFAVVSLVLTIKTQKRYLQTLTFWTTVFVLQFCIILMINKLIPIIMWQ